MAACVRPTQVLMFNHVSCFHETGDAMDALFGLHLFTTSVQMRSQCMPLITLGSVTSRCPMTSRRLPHTSHVKAHIEAARAVAAFPPRLLQGPE